MPLPDGPYERGKCAFKLLQYMALARPGLASPVGANVEVVTDGLDGFLPADDEAWDAQLTRLIGDPALRQEMGGVPGPGSKRPTRWRWWPIVTRI